MSVGMSRYALSRAVEYANSRQVWKSPIGAHRAGGTGESEMVLNSVAQHGLGMPKSY